MATQRTRQAALIGLLVGALTLESGTALAQVLHTLPTEDMSPGQRPHLKPRQGMQMAVSTGVRFPMGDASHTPGDTLAARYSYQVPVVVDIGSKFGDHWYLGGYLGMAMGAEGNRDVIEEYCEDDDGNLSNDISCSTYAYRAGVMAQLHLAPAAEYNPWLGYGFGVETLIQTLSDAPRRVHQQTQTTGITYARVDLGVDYRAKGGLGVGLYSEANLGRFAHTRTEIDGATTYVGGVQDPAWHLWLGAGARLVLFP